MSIPSLSIVICTYNRDRYLQQCLEHLNQQTCHPGDFEILVVDNNSTDRTSLICQDFRTNNSDINFKYLKQPQQGLSYSRNLGLEKASAPLISYLDDDAYPDSHYVQNLCDYFQSHSEVDAIGGKITPAYEKAAPNWMSKYLLPLVAALDMGRVPVAFKPWKFPIGANMAFRASVLRDIGGFNPQLGRKGDFLGSGEEKDVFLTLHQSKKIIHYVPAVHVFHTIPNNRLESDYIKKMAIGIGMSEATRLQQAPWKQRIIKWLQEFFKIGATIILVLYYTITFRWPKANMLLKFRIWVLNGFLKA
ncbi:MAG: glycosyltransferase family 2 protein [Cyclobacteriaceae bacterium]|nr:glycosyltransferase family 2 protein [Cyclobacteriaceae bacterium]